MAVKKQSRILTARNADKYELYEASVYQPEDDLVFIEKVFRRGRGRSPRVLREDFAGTSRLSAMWATRFADGTAYAVDLDAQPLAWGRARHLERLGEAAMRVHQIQANVLTARTPPADAVTAFNFSYWIFRERRTMLAYFRHVRRSLRPDGAFFLDLMGGPGIQKPCEEKTRERGFTYVWEQEATDAIQQHVRCHIHFDFPGGSRMRRAFTYDWRLWSLPELRDLMAEAGFDRIEVQWDVEPPGVEPRYRPRRHAANQGAWLAYLVGRRPGRSAR